MRSQRIVVVALLGALIGLVPASPTSASPSLTITVSLAPNTNVAVGDQNKTGRVVITNNSAPAEIVTVTDVTITPSCNTADYPCSSPDIGAIVVKSAAGATATACPQVFSIAGPDTTGRYSLTPASPVVLQPNATCRIDFVYDIPRMPATNPTKQVAAATAEGSTQSVTVFTSTATTVNKAIVNATAQISPGASVPVGTAVTVTFTLSSNITPTGTVTIHIGQPCSAQNIYRAVKPIVDGVAVADPVVATSPGQWQLNLQYLGDANNAGQNFTCDRLPTISITKAIPMISTNASPSTHAGGTISATAALGGYNPTGSVTFSVYGPDDPTCGGQPKATSTHMATGAGTYQSDPYTAALPGTYRWKSSYSGDSNNNGVSSLCNAASAAVVVSQRMPVTDFDGNGSSDRSLYRPSTSQFVVKNGSPEVMQYGSAGDLAVPADYNGDRVVDKSVFRPGTGQWFIRDAAPVPEVTPYGQVGDVPVPADYDGDGRADIAVYRPSTGQWFVRGGSPEVIQYGLGCGACEAPTDIPVPGDYDGDGRADIAVYRTTTGQWFVRGAAREVTQYGVDGDRPVPGDYDGDGKADLAVFRPSTGQWFFRGLPMEVVQYGAPGPCCDDVPSPGDFDGNGVTDVAVYRRSTNQWFVRGGAPEVLHNGQPGDIPLPLPYAIRTWVGLLR